MELQKYSENLLENISKDYIEMNNLIKLPNAPRWRNISYSLVCEKNIVDMIMDILKEKDYHYNMDIPLNKCINSESIEEEKINSRWQPDLVIQDKSNNIVAIIEIKYQIGYWDYNETVNKIKNHKYEDKTIIVNLLESTRNKKINLAIDALKGTKIGFYTLYNSKIKYNQIDKINENDYKNIFTGEHGFESFIERIKKL